MLTSLKDNVLTEGTPSEQILAIAVTLWCWTGYGHWSVWTALGSSNERQPGPLRLGSIRARALEPLHLLRRRGKFEPLVATNSHRDAEKPVESSPANPRVFW